MKNIFKFKSSKKLVFLFIILFLAIPVYADEIEDEIDKVEVNFTIEGLENVNIHEEIEFKINAQIIDEEGVLGEDVPLRYKAVLTINDEPLSVSQRVYYGETYEFHFETDTKGNAYFGPAEGFTLEHLPELKGEGITTNFKSKFEQLGNYTLELSLVDISSDVEEVIGQPKAISFTAIYIPPRLPEIVVKAKYPGEDSMYDEHSLFSEVINETRRYFIRITFEDTEEELFFNDANGLNYLRTSRLFPEGSSHANLIDLDLLNYISSLESNERQEYIEHYIFNKNATAKEACLYIPIRFPQPGTTYEVIVNPNIVLAENEEGQVGNELIMWKFNTMNIPYINDITPGSVPENYDTGESVIIRGGFFADNIDVYFGDTRAYRVYTRNHDGESYLEVLLPRGRNKLEPGIYNVSVENSRNHEQLYHGIFSVVPKGSHIPDGDYRVIDEIRQGDILSSVNTSENKLLLSSRYRNARSLEFDLDELMGAETMVRKIEFEGGKSDRIDELITKSQWADITIHGLSVINSTRRDEKARVSLGRVEPFVAQIAKSRLMDGNIKSDLIQVTLDNCRYNRMSMSIPFGNSDGQNLKVMRYDERTRSWSNVDHYTVNLVNRKVTLQDFRPGIYAVVE